MSGHLRIVSTSTPIQKHDHIDFVFGDTQVLRFNDPRRFGSVHWHEGKVSSHPLLKHLGPEPLSEDFHGDYLFQRSRKKTTPVKNFIMDSHVVVGVGNIYANEALFSAHIRPQSRAGGISKKRYELLTTEIKSTLSNALEVGGTTLRDYVGSNGEPGYFSLQLAVYGRADQPCLVCNQKLKGIVIGQRQTVYCRVCQQR